MWYEAIMPNKSWASLWSDYVLCACSGIRNINESCTLCGLMPPSNITVFPGAENRYEDWVYLVMLEQEWKRTLTDADYFPTIAARCRPTPRAVIVLIFWSYFETRIERFLRQATRNLPEKFSDDFLNRYSSIGSRLDKCCRLIFSTTYWTVLEDCGYGDISILLKRVHQARNRFAHGHPEAIDESLVHDLVEGLKREHEAWIAMYNRATAASQNQKK